MTDPFTPRMPKELEDTLFESRVKMRHATVDFCDWLKGFLEETWDECHHTHLEVHAGKTIEVPGTPDFNRFDREFAKVKQAAGKVRWALWDIHKAARSAVPQPAEGGADA